MGRVVVEAKLTESDFQIKAEAVVEAYRDFGCQSFDRELLPRVEWPPGGERGNGVPGGLFAGV